MIEGRFYVVEVSIPLDVVERFGRDTDYSFAITQATRGASAAGRKFEESRGVFEWAEYKDLPHAQRCEAELDAAVAKFSARLATPARVRSKNQ